MQARNAVRFFAILSIFLYLLIDLLPHFFGQSGADDLDDVVLLKDHLAQIVEKFAVTVNFFSFTFFTAATDLSLLFTVRVSISFFLTFRFRMR